MDITRTDKEIIVKLPADIDTLGLQRFINYLKYKVATANSNSSQSEVDNLAEESKSNWWKENKDRFIK